MTPSTSPLRTMTLSATLVKRPKKAFQSPGTHQRIRNSWVLLAVAMYSSTESSRQSCRRLGGVRMSGARRDGQRGPLPQSRSGMLGGAPPHAGSVPAVSRVAHPVSGGRRDGLGGERGKELRRIADPAEDAALCLDHLQRHPLELWEVRCHAVREYQAVVAAIVRLADGGVDADLGGHAADDQAGDAFALEDGIQVGREIGR